MKVFTALVLFSAQIAVAKKHKQCEVLESLLDTIVDRGYLRVGTTGDYKPFSYLPSNSTNTTAFIGADIELSHSLASSLSPNLTVQFVPTIWGNLTSDLENGKYDIAMGGISITLARQLKGFFSIPNERVGKAATVRCEDVERFSSLEKIDVVGTKVVVNPGGSNEAFVRENIKEATIVPFPDNVLIFGEVVDKRADVMITDVVEAQLQAIIHPEVLCAVNPETPFDFSELGYLMSRDIALKQFVDQWLHISIASGAWNEIHSRWMNYEWPTS